MGTLLARLLAVLVIALGVPMLSWAQAQPGGGTCADFLNALGRRESGLNAGARNQYGYLGLFQMGEAALADAGYYRPDGSGTNDWRGQWTGANGVNSVQDFLSNPAAQAQAVTAYHQRVWSYIQGNNLDQYLGQQINGVTMTRSGLIAAAHLVGTGNLGQYLRSNGTVVPVDGNRTPVSEYIQRFGGYELTGAGNNCAQFATGRPTGGVGSTDPTGGGRVPTPALGPPAVPMDPDEAFSRGSGVSMQAVHQAIQLILAAIALGTAALLVSGAWGRFTGGRTAEVGGLVGDLVRIAVVATLFMVLLR